MDASLFIAPESITRDGITIRAYRPGDGPELRIATTSSYEHLRPWMPWATREDSVEAAEARCRRFAAHYLLNEDFVLGIWVGEQLAGGTGFHLRGTPLTLRSAEIGMWIRGSYAGQGLGTRALRVMLKWGFEEWNWERLSWHCDTRNIASARVAQKNGMILEGTLRSDALDVEGRRRDTYVFSMLPEEWEQRNQP
ncbi:MAG TPA: GNAT family protein [Roseiflexaceae bacterium]|nr:GNAT family protein [Roseiflexaceae bacterium]